MSNNLVCKPDNIIQEDWLKRLAVIVRENEKDFEWFRDAIDRQLLKERFNVSKLEKQQDLLFKENERNVREIGRLREDIDKYKKLIPLAFVINFFVQIGILLFIL